MATKRQFVEVYNATGRKAGLTPTFEAWAKTATPNTDITPKPSIVESTLHPGVYYFDYDVSEDYIWTIICSAIDEPYRRKSGRVGPGDGNTTILVTPTYTYPVTFHVQDELGAPVADVEVVARDAAEAGSPLQFGRTNASGNYSATLNAGNFAARAWGRGITVSNPTLFTVAGAMTVTINVVNFVPNAPAAGEQTLYGTVLHGNKTAGASARIVARPVDENQIVSGTFISLVPSEGVANALGVWQIPVVKLAKYDVFEVYGGTQFFRGRIQVTTDVAKDLSTYTFIPTV